jgi:O-methyltransferase domain
MRGVFRCGFGHSKSSPGTFAPPDLETRISEQGPADRRWALTHDHCRFRRSTGCRARRLHPDQLRRVRFEAMDFLQAIPARCRAYLMKNIIHDWDDQRARQILFNCRRAVPEVGVLLLIEYCVDGGQYRRVSARRFIPATARLPIPPAARGRRSEPRRPITNADVTAGGWLFSSAPRRVTPP